MGLRHKMEEKDCWMWKKPPPISKQPVEDSEDLEDGRKMRRVNQRTQNVKAKVLKDFSCHICQKVLNSPVTTPCAHNFCKACLEGAFAGISFIKERTCEGRRTLRSQKNVMKCPLCSNDIAEFLQNLKVSTELKQAIEKLQKKEEDFEEEEEAEEEEEEEEEAEEEEEIDYASEETLDETKESNSSVPQTDTTPPVACEQKKPARKRKKLNNAENVVDGGMMAKKSQKSKVAAV